MKRPIFDPTADDDDDEITIGSDPFAKDDRSYDGSPSGDNERTQKLPNVTIVSSNTSVGSSSVSKPKKRGMKGSKSTGSLPKINEPKRTNPVEKFNELLNTIVRSKASGGALIEDVSKQWSKFSQY